MKVWEYYWVTFDASKEDMDKIDKIGREGWELVNIIPWKEGNLKGFAVLKKSSYFAVLKNRLSKIKSKP